ncbi:putative copper resistance protein D [Tamaricihabitans halophyticus]|uniref:Putative copper resistance protein D n=1 Tax=Tamaricihabitans halophyticus TaxID=1262583 RepID=A0A4R2R632_9PSEU|nr:cytochrome c oxidase assembly protein [Tamaricihabitans halophyticus]TCP57487.1 putative copper resistance protein D [Tamaricihabitans halophyticus]
MRFDRTLAISAAIGLAYVLVIVWLAGDVHGILGDSDPGRLTGMSVGAVRFGANASAVVAMGALAFAAFLVPTGRSSKLVADSYAAVRLAHGAATIWTVCAAAMIPLAAADSSGKSLGEALPILPDLIDATVEPKAWLFVFAIAAAVAIGSRSTLSWGPVVLWFAVAVVGLLAPMVAGNGSVGAWHDVTTNALVWHVLAAGLWVGSLVALWLFWLRPTARDRERVLARYHRVTLGCVIVLILSGAIAGMPLARPEGLTTGYGLLLLCKLAICALVPLARLRWGARHTLAVELLALGVAMGATVGLTYLVPPAFVLDRASIAETIVGYELPFGPDIGALFGQWRFDLILGLAAVLAAFWYLRAVTRLRRRGDHWSRWRTVAWLLGCLVVLLATSSGIGFFSPGSFSMHMVVHMLLGMLAPVLLVQGGPVTLALRTLPPEPRGWLVSLMHSRAARIATNPVLVTVVYVGSYYLLYLSDLFETAMLEHWSHQLMNVHFLVSGYLFFWLVSGVDRPPRPMVHLAKLGMLFAVMPFHAFFGVIVMNSNSVIAETYYGYLSLDWVPDLLADQRLAGGIAWAAGEAPMLIVLIALLAQWASADKREASRAERQADRDEDERLAAYNAMLAELADRQR